jgi:hypothetical protein
MGVERPLSSSTESSTEVGMKEAREVVADHSISVCGRETGGHC